MYSQYIYVRTFFLNINNKKFLFFFFLFIRKILSNLFWWFLWFIVLFEHWFVRIPNFFCTCFRKIHKKRSVSAITMNFAYNCAFVATYTLILVYSALGYDSIYLLPFVYTRCMCHAKMCHKRITLVQAVFCESFWKFGSTRVTRNLFTILILKNHRRGTSFSNERMKKRERK